MNRGDLRGAVDALLAWTGTVCVCVYMCEWGGGESGINTTTAVLIWLDKQSARVQNGDVVACA